MIGTEIESPPLQSGRLCSSTVVKPLEMVASARQHRPFVRQRHSHMPIIFFWDAVCALLTSAHLPDDPCGRSQVFLLHQLLEVSHFCSRYPNPPTPPISPFTSEWPVTSVGPLFLAGRASPAVKIFDCDGLLFPVILYCLGAGHFPF